MSLISKLSRANLRHLRNTTGPATFALLVVLVILLVAAIAWLVATGGPWEKAVQKKLASGKELNWQQYRQLGVGWGMLGVSGLLAFVIACAPWWIKPCRAVLSDQPRPRRPRLALQLYVLALLVAAGATWFLRSPRLTHSFWNDEEMAFRKYVWGETKVQPDGALKFTPVTWGPALYDNEKANNQVGSTIETRAGMALRNNPVAGSPQDVPAFQESAARTFPFISSGLTVLALGWLGWLLGAPRVGLAAALLLTLSPWHLRYSVEIRGYSTMLLMLTLCLGSLLRALETSFWRWWLAFAATQAWYLLCFAGSIYVPVAMNGIALLAIWRSQRDARSNSLRLVVANTVSAVPLAILLTPSLLQIMDYVKDPKNREGNAPIDFVWFQDFWSHLTLGISWDHDVTGSNGTNALALGSKISWLPFSVTWVLPALLVAGVCMMIWRDWRSRLVALPLLLGAVLATLHAKVSGGPFLSWYLIYTLPLFCVAVPFVATRLPKQWQILPLFIVGSYFLMTQEPRQLLMAAPRQPMREAAQWARNEQTTVVGSDPKTLTAVFATSSEQIHSYDPRAIILESKQQLTELMTQARTEQRPLAVYFCNRAPTKKAELCRELREELDETGNWKKEATLPGLEPMWSYHVYLLNNLHEKGQRLFKK